MNLAAANPASWRSVAAYAAAPVFLAIITDRVIAVIRQHILPAGTQSAWAPIGCIAIAGLRLAAVVALYLLRILLAPSETLRGLRQMVLDAAPVPEVTRMRPVSSESLLCAGHDHGIQEQGSGRPSEDEYAAEDGSQDQDRGADQIVTGFRTKKAAFLITST